MPGVRRTRHPQLSATLLKLMNKKQIALLIFGLTIFSLSELFPPWVYEDENTSAKRFAGYHFIYTPPKIKSPAEMRRIFSLRPEDSTQFMWVHQEPGMLFSQRLAIIFVVLGGLLLFSERRRMLNVVAGYSSLCVGLAFLILRIWVIPI